MLPGHPITTYLSPRGSEFATEATCSGVECAFATVVDHLMLLVWLGIIGLVVLATLLYLPKAKEICAEEWARTRAEQDAFERFIKRVTAIEVQPVQVHEGGMGVAPLSHAHDGVRQLRQVQDAYRETVMSVPHYDEEYGETLREHMSAEFSEDLTAAVCDGGQVTPQLIHGLVHHGKQAREERTALLETLNREADALTEASSSMGEIDASLPEYSEHRLTKRSFDELTAGYNELKHLNDRCKALVDDRQRSLHDGVQLGRRINEASHFYTYLYHPLKVTYPVLSDGTRLIAEIERAQSRVVQAISRRV